MKTDSHLSPANSASQVQSRQTDPAQADVAVRHRRWRQLTSVAALLVEIPLALALIAAALLATLPGMARD